MRTPLLFLLFLASALANGQSFRTVNDGAWLDPSTWDCTCVPLGGDSVRIDHAVTFATDVALDTTNFDLSQSGSLIGAGGVSLRCRSIVNLGTVQMARLHVLGMIPQYALSNDGSITAEDVLLSGGFFNTGLLRVQDSLVWVGQSLNGADAKVVCSVLSGTHHQNFGVDSIGTMADLNIGCNGNFSALVVSGDATNITFSGENAHFLGNASFAQFAVGYNCKVDGDMIITGPSNFVSGQIQVGGALVIQDVVNLVDSTALFWAQHLFNFGSIFGDGSFCITDTVINSGFVYGNIDICDLSPTTTIPPFIDGGQGPIAPSVTFCMGGYCAVGIAENAEGPELRVLPNPTSGAVTLKGASVGSAWELIDMNGRILFTGRVDSDQQVIATDGLMPGVYLLRARSGNTSATVRLLKQ